MPDKPLPDAGQQPDQPCAAETETISEEEIAALPDIESLTAETDIRCFMRRGVPAPLRNAALRKIWMLDPAIRDFAGHARDYAYDWNSPGGVPGNGSFRSAEEVALLLRRVLGEPDAMTEAPKEGDAVTADRRDDSDTQSA